MPELKPTYMLEEYEKKKQKRVSLMRSIMDYAMGVLMILLGALIFFHQQLKITVNDRLPADTVKVLGGLMALYGAWRIYKGYKKNYSQ